MNRMHKTTGVFAVLALALILVGCSAPTIIAAPTEDIPAIRTESAKTVVAKITIEAALEPTATPVATQAAPEPIVITATPQPSATAETVIIAATATLIPTTRPVTGGGLAPTATRRTGPDQAQFVSQEPTDGTDYNSNDEFDAKWTFKNVGTSTWTTAYEYRFASGTNLAKATKYTVPQNVAPGETVTLIADMLVPSDKGRYISSWELVNENGDVFFSFYTVIDVP